MKKIQKKVSSKDHEYVNDRKQSEQTDSNSYINNNGKGYVLANTPLNMEDEERNPDCRW